jgi:uncharacterized protein YndB with AHSA1/START domain
LATCSPACEKAIRSFAWTKPERLKKWFLMPSPGHESAISLFCTSARISPPTRRFTEVTLTHERFPNPKVPDDHNQGWNACLDGLARVLEETAPKY